MKNKIDRDRGTHPAKGVSLDLSDDAQASDDSRRVEGASSDSKGSPSHDNEEQYNGGKAYAEFLKLFFKGKNG